MLIRDNVHGDITLTENETRILDCPEVQRLRTIKQLGTAYLVYPGCTHTRFEHSLGTLAVAKQIMTTLTGNGHALSARDAELISIAALLHDVTHIPFGHTFEDERKIFTRHDKGTRLDCFLRQEGALGGALSKLGLLDDLRNILNGTCNDWRQQIISSALDADLLDYLKRDSYLAGLAQTYDQRIFQHFRVVAGQLVLNMTKHNMDRPDIKSEIIHLLRLRYYLTERVYFHHAKVVSGAMISKALELSLEYGLSEQDLMYLGDYTLFERLKEIGFKHNPAISKLITAVEMRQLLKRAYILSAEGSFAEQKPWFIKNYHLDQSRRAKLEQEIAYEAGVSPSQVIIYCPGDRTFREAAIPVLTRDGLQKLNSLTRAPEDIKLLEKQYEQLWRFYVFAPATHTSKVKSICEELWHFPSEHL